MLERKLIWSEKAIENLEEIFVYFEKRNRSNEYGSRLLHRIEDKLEHYLSAPELGQGDGTSGRRFFLCGKYRVFYRFTDSTFEIIKIWDGRCDPGSSKFE